MELLGNYDLFQSVIIIGSHYHNNPNIEINKVFSKWIKFKEEDPFMLEMNKSQTQYVAAISIIKLDLFKSILNDLKEIYRRDYEYADEQDFINDMFGFSLHKMEEFLNQEFRFLPTPPEITRDYSFYTYFHPNDRLYRDLIIPSNNSINQIKQYFKKISHIIKAVTFEEIGNSEDLETMSTSSKNKPSLKELITHTDSERIVEAIKIRYKNIAGKELKFLLLALQDLELIPRNRIAKKFHICCQNDFEWEIKSYQAMNDYQLNELYDLGNIDEIKSYIKSLL